ncbi:MAG: hypothetical protein ACK50J_10110, partial [Planctomyces sp.]
MAKDVALHHIQAPSMVVEKDRILIEGLVTASLFSGTTGEIQLLEGESVLESRMLNITHDQEDQRFHFEVPTARSGRREFTLRAVELPGEHTAENNTATLAVDVTEASVSILIADSRARWEYQYLVNLFRRQKQIEFDQLHFQPEVFGTGHREKDRKLPQTADEWSAYRLVILGDVTPDHLTDASQESLREYLVQRGGNLIVIAGQNSMPHDFGEGPLLDLLPVESVPEFQPDKSGYRVELTPEGRSVDAMRLDEDMVTTEAVWREMSDLLPVYSLSGFHKPKPASEVLLSAASRSGNPGAESAAFLAWHRIGAGRVAFLSSPSTYQLRMRNGDKYHHRFWGQLIRWMLSGASVKGSRFVRLGSDKLKYEQGDVAQFTVDLTDPQGHPVSNAAPEIQIFSAEQLVNRLELRPDEKVPGRYQGRFSAEQSGRYQARATGAEVERLLAAENYQESVQVEITFEPPISRELT